MTKQGKNILFFVKEHMDEARQKIDLVRFGEPQVNEKEYQALSEVSDLLCAATDKIYNI